MRWLSTGLSGQEKFLPLVAVVAAAVALAAPVHADVDTDFANQLHGYGIYGQRDYNAWLGKITCNRLGYGVDADAYKSAAFLSKNLPRNSTTAQTWQFMNAAINNYCPDQMPVLNRLPGPADDVAPRLPTRYRRGVETTGETPEHTEKCA